MPWGGIKPRGPLATGPVQPVRVPKPRPSEFPARWLAKERKTLLPSPPPASQPEKRPPSVKPPPIFRPAAIRFVVRTLTPNVRRPCLNHPPCDPPWHTYDDETFALPDGTPTELQVGDAYYLTHTGECAWTNCDGRHLYVCCPDGNGGVHPWNVDGRASNCTLKEERTHRCWIRTGSPANGTLDVAKAGHTCAAGAGSILIGRFHGFVRSGRLVQA